MLNFSYNLFLVIFNQHVPTGMVPYHINLTRKRKTDGRVELATLIASRCNNGTCADIIRIGFNLWILMDLMELILTGRYFHHNKLFPRSSKSGKFYALGWEQTPERPSIRSRWITIPNDYTVLRPDISTSTWFCFLRAPILGKWDGGSTRFGWRIIEIQNI
jgi:hypothetical protein